VSTLRDAALDYATAGYEVFPLRGKLPRPSCPTCRQPGPGRPNPRYRPHQAAGCAGTQGHELCHGLLAASSDPDRVATWWRRWPQANIGARVPKSLLVLDVDPRHGGDQRLAELEAAHLPLPITRTSYSGRGDGGHHRWFLHPGGKPSAARLGQGLDVKTHSGYVLLPPSRHPDTGQPYWWATPLLEPARVPLWLRSLLAPAPRPRILAGQDQRRGTRATNRLAAWVQRQPEGDRNSALYWAALRAVEGGCDARELDALAEAAMRAGLPEAEARRTVASARQAGGVL
jgi:hypothetical protein